MKSVSKRVCKGFAPSFYRFVFDLWREPYYVYTNMVIFIVFLFFHSFSLFQATASLIPEWTVNATLATCLKKEGISCFNFDMS